ncbi:hypothetical protein HU200_003574 [Digitaria exilis]|uniref:Leucine-rich repeat-containing N-terminal plant-type domain-containing protein n=1 Tax=Digitaria exilis TaxID=1010633 RepID=A0A835KUI2_9POAL|nr:hypothetical protein HU200_003574 [Digitaria exilis]
MAFTGFAITVLLLSLASDARPCSDHEKSSLLRFITGLSLDGGLAMSWRRNGTASCCSWEGIACNGDEVSLPGRGLQGSISPVLGDLTGLRRLNLSHNSLSGELPLERLLSSSRNLAVIDVSFNGLEGELPYSVASHGWTLQVLNISSNLFTGEFPSASFVMLDLSYNKFSGRIPAGLGNCSGLKVLKAGHNKLSGALPDELFNASSLEYLSFPNNGLYGTLDGASITNLRNLSHLDLGGNQLNGKIPDTIELPSALSNCTNLVTIDLRNNNFSGELAMVDFSTLINLKTLDLLYNNFTGTVPESIYSCSNLKALRLSDNKLHGQLSPRISNLKSLVFLNFKGEAMPQDETIDGFQNLQFLSLSKCSLTGKIPLWLSKLKILEILFLEKNQLTGPIPAWIKNISNNSLTGEIPTALTTMPMLTSKKSTARLQQRVYELPIYVAHALEYHIPTAFPVLLNLGRNNFTGLIPDKIGQLKTLVSLNLGSNKLTGEIPQSICNLTNLQVLDLSGNDLTGGIPMGLNNLHFLSKFNISNNDLEGPIPINGQISTFPSSSFDGNPKLCGPMLAHHCGPAETTVFTEETDERVKKVMFLIAFGAFFGVGVMYDQLVLSRFFG